MKIEHTAFRADSDGRYYIKTVFWRGRCRNVVLAGGPFPSLDAPQAAMLGK